jgi:hypothetical protein
VVGVKRIEEGVKRGIGMELELGVGGGAYQKDA